jgi:hypothetical protein
VDVEFVEAGAASEHKFFAEVRVVGDFAKDPAQ